MSFSVFNRLKCLRKSKPYLIHIHFLHPSILPFETSKFKTVMVSSWRLMLITNIIDNMNCIDNWIVFKRFAVQTFTGSLDFVARNRTPSVQFNYQPYYVVCFYLINHMVGYLAQDGHSYYFLISSMPFSSALWFCFIASIHQLILKDWFFCLLTLWLRCEA